MYKFLFLFFMLGAAAIIYKSLERSYLSQTVIARVTLTTNCDLDPKAFAVRNMTSGEVREFQHGEAFIKATLADELMVVLSEKFDQVSFEGEVVPVKQKLEIFQDCRKPVGIDGIFKSFNEQFAAK
tara:strand:+ start:1123 stop:1500 length:378 start_codon:yes stop_codon:yes gene_type:complete